MLAIVIIIIIIISLNDVQSTFPLSDPFQVRYINVAFIIASYIYWYAFRR